jgi:hypothetical protein
MEFTVKDGDYDHALMVEVKMVMVKMMVKVVMMVKMVKMVVKW